MDRLDQFMARANACYYATRDPYADFTTSPEISQVFGELLGLWAAVVWEQIGRPVPVVLAEAGPGRGTLMTDALRALRQTAPGFAAALRLVLIESSPRLRALQAERLPGACWIDGLNELPGAPLILLANEFLDALPIRQFVRRGAGWTERFVDRGMFHEHPAAAPPDPVAAAEGDVIEVGETARAATAALAARVVAQGGAALIIDYGPATGAPGESLQALRGSRPADPLARPGEADLTAHVDFGAIAATAAAAGAAVHGPVAQGKFLTRLGLYPRSHILARGADPVRAAALIEAARRLAEPDRMGSLFKVLALCQPGRPTPPGFEP